MAKDAKNTNLQKDLLTFAKLIKKMVTDEIEKEKGIGLVIGEVIKAPPELEVQVDENIIVKKHQIVLAQNTNIDYWRNFEIETGEKVGANPYHGEKEESQININTNDGTFSGSTLPNATGITATTTATVGGSPTPGVVTIVDPQHDHQLKEWSIQNNKFTAKGTIKFTNSLKKGDKVIMISDRAEKFFVLIDKAVRL